MNLLQSEHTMMKRTWMRVSSMLQNELTLMKTEITVKITCLLVSVMTKTMGTIHNTTDNATI